MYRKVSYIKSNLESLLYRYTSKLYIFIIQNYRLDMNQFLQNRL
jgi:hypothetical protein